MTLAASLHVSYYFRFRDISAKMPGSVHDASVLKASRIYEQAYKLPKVCLLAQF